MTETLISCPSCGTEFPVSEALAARLRAELEEGLRQEGDARLRKAVEDAEARARDALALELQDLKTRLAEQQHKAEDAATQELALRKRTRELEERQQGLDLEIERRLEAERERIEKSLRAQIEEVQGLKLKEKEKQIEDLRKALEEARRRSEQGSQELQGEVLELSIQSALEQQFPQDRILPVPKGVRGADLVQEVRDGALRPCGKILWETKNTKHWSPAWVEKLKEDQRAVGASLAVLVSVALPAELIEFGQVSGVWVASLRAWPALAVVLREQLIQVAFAHAASEGKQEKMELLYRYLAGDEFRHRVESIVEAFTALEDQLQKERRAMERLWAEREKQIHRVMSGTVGMYGDLQGLIGASLPAIPALDLDADALLEHRREE